MKRAIVVLALVLLGLLALSLLPSGRRLDQVAQGDFQGNEACEACLAQADTDWEECVANEAGGDRGDAACQSRREQAQINCQTTYCISLASNQTAPLGTNLLIPTVLAQDEGSGKVTEEQARAVCFAQKDAYFYSCSLLGGSTASCMDAAWAIYSSCMTAHGYPRNL